MRVLIIGAGPTGLTLALALRHRGIPYRLIECRTGPERWSRALGLQARTLEVLDRLGLAERFLAAAHPLEGAAFHLPGHVLGEEVRMRFQHVHPRFPSMVILPQYETERLLTEAGAGPEFGVEFLEMQNGNALLRHEDGRLEWVTADWIAGCDGAHSSLRHSLDLPFPGHRYPQQLVLADLPLDGLSPTHMHAFPDGPAPLICFPLPDGCWRTIALLPPDAPPPAQGSLAPFQRPGLTLGEASWWNLFRISQRQVPRMQIDRRLLLGDAAHIHSPAGGQGMNLGIQDAWSLAAAIAAGPEAVGLWAGRRHKLARHVIRATDLLTRMMTARSPLLASLRGRTFRLAAGSPALARQLELSLSGLRYPPPSA
ncbi:FAD-dependent monooxygenase [Roseomonas gilardii subsp. gilardii]|uniref:FAD-dependent oxidoreductase n=1 Tax=Roseomonas gilardii TaxID=257708 RepID=UPI001FFBA421|nr:FAD-dependent monooxygenase [Roseomonas gilardii]UPG73958.1 FAD-dependent monooxygenase [Roseomonas gilardii subsp. gilardii]